MTSYHERLQNFYNTCNTQHEQTASSEGKLLINGASCRIEYVDGRRTLIMDTHGRKDCAKVCSILKSQGLVRDKEMKSNVQETVNNFATSDCTITM